MENIINKLEQKSLSNEDIMNFCNGKVNIVTYKELNNYNSLDEVLHPFDACILLYETKESYGHWCAIVKISDDEVEFFDSYGLFPDDEKSFINPAFLIKSGQKLPILTRLLYECPYKLSFNEHKFQSDKNNMNTCGRWCCLRVKLKRLTLKEFKKVFTSSNYNPDFIATLLSLEA